MRVKLDILVDEIKIIMRELHQNMHFYDTRSTRYSASSSIENFQKAEMAFTVFRPNMPSIAPEDE